MKILRKRKKDSEKRISWTQPKNGLEGSIIVDGKVFNGNYENRQNDFDEVYKDVKTYLKDKKGNKKKSFYYRPGERLVFSGHTSGVKDSSGRLVTFMYKDSKKGKSGKEAYRDFLKDSETGLKNNGYPQGTLDKKLKEAIKKEIRKQHKIYKIKKISKIAVPLALAVVGGTYLYNKNKKKKEN